MIRFITSLFITALLAGSQAIAQEVKQGPLEITVYAGEDRLSELDVTSTLYQLPGEAGTLGMALSCKRFIQPDGTLGDWGEELVKAISRVGQSCFRDIADYSVMCPNYKNFSKAKKWQFVVFFFAAKAFQESSCDPDKVGTGIGNGAPVGLFQLEDDNLIRQSNQRDPTFCSPGVANKAKEIKFQMECAAAMFRSGYCTITSNPNIHPTGRGGMRAIGGRLMDNNYYWQELNIYWTDSNGDGVLDTAPELPPRIIRRVQKFPGCTAQR